MFSSTCLAVRLLSLTYKDTRYHHAHTIHTQQSTHALPSSPHSTAQHNKQLQTKPPTGLHQIHVLLNLLCSQTVELDVYGYKVSSRAHTHTHTHTPINTGATQRHTDTQCVPATHLHSTLQCAVVKWQTTIAQRTATKSSTSRPASDSSSLQTAQQSDC
jgi:hypothetical protein